MRVSVYRYIFVSAPGSYEMGRHKQSIIITIKHVCDSLLWEKKRRDINKRPEHTFCARTLCIHQHFHPSQQIPSDSCDAAGLRRTKRFSFSKSTSRGWHVFVRLSLYLLPHASRVFIAILVATRLSCDYSFTCCHKTLLCLSQYLLPYVSRVFIALLVATLFSCVYRFTCCHTSLVWLSLYLLPHVSRVFTAVLVATCLSCVYRFICFHTPLVCLSPYLFPHASRVFIILFPRASRVFIAILVVTRLSVCLSLYLFPRASHRWAEGTRARRTRKPGKKDTETEYCRHPKGQVQPVQQAATTG